MSWSKRGSATSRRPRPAPMPLSCCRWAAPTPCGSTTPASTYWEHVQVDPGSLLHVARTGRDLGAVDGAGQAVPSARVPQLPRPCQGRATGAGADRGRCEHARAHPEQAEHRSPPRVLGSAGSSIGPARPIHRRVDAVTSAAFARARSRRLAPLGAAGDRSWRPCRGLHFLATSARRSWPASRRTDDRCRPSRARPCMR